MPSFTEVYSRLVASRYNYSLVSQETGLSRKQLENLRYYREHRKKNSSEIFSEALVFLDAENFFIRSEALGITNPSLKELMDKVRKYGLIKALYAFANFNKYPIWGTTLHLYGFELINVPTYEVISNSSKVVKNAVDIELIMKVLLEAFEAKTHNELKTFILVSGDADYLSLSNSVQNKLGQRFVVIGMKGSISNSLAFSSYATETLGEAESKEMLIVKKDIVSLVRKGPFPLVYWTMSHIREAILNEQKGIKGTIVQKDIALTELKREGVLRQFRRIENKKFLETALNVSRAHQLGYLRDKEVLKVAGRC